jgi:transposase-like protein
VAYVAPTGQRYSDEERTAALELAANTSIMGAAKALGITRGTLYDWIRKYPEKWSDLRADPTAGKRKVAQQLDVLVERYTDVEHDMLDKVESGEIVAQDAKEAAALMKAFGGNRQAAIAGSRSISGDPDVVEHNVNFPQIEKLMAQMLETAQQPALVVPNEAESDG